MSSRQSKGSIFLNTTLGLCRQNRFSLLKDISSKVSSKSSLGHLSKLSPKVGCKPLAPHPSIQIKTAPPVKAAIPYTYNSNACPSITPTTSSLRSSQTRIPRKAPRTNPPLETWPSNLHAQRLPIFSAQRGRIPRKSKPPIIYDSPISSSDHLPDFLLLPASHTKISLTSFLSDVELILRFSFIRSPKRPTILL